MNLQPLFDEPILEQRELSPGYEDHGNDIVAVTTASGRYVVRLPRIGPYGKEDPFWWGCAYLFGIRLGALDQLTAIHTALARVSPLPVPRILRTGQLAGRPYAVLTHLPGDQVGDLPHQPPALLEQLGQTLATIHQERFATFGTVNDERRKPLSAFPARLAETFAAVVDRFFPDDREIQAALPAMAAAARRLPPPAFTSLVMIDLDPSQFLSAGAWLTALVDAEAYAIAPRELELIGLELIVDAPSAAAFARGYRTVLPLPDLAAARPVYRFLYRLLEVQGDIPLSEVMARPTLF